MKWFRVDNFFEAWRPVYRLLRMFSLTTVTYNFRDQTAERTSADQTLFIVGMLISLLALYYSFAYYQDRLFVLTNSHIISTGRFGTLIFIVVAHAVTVITNYVKAYRIAKFPKNIDKIDHQITKLFKHSMDYQAEHLRIVLFITFRYLGWIIVALIIGNAAPLDGLNWIESLSLGLSFLWINLGFQTKILSILIMIAAIRKRFMVLNKILLELSNNRGSTIDTDQLRMQLTKIAILHDQLSDIVDHFNSCHSSTVMCALATAFSFVVFSTFAMIHAFAANVDASIFRIAWTSMVFDIILVSNVVYILIFSGQVNDDCKQTAVLVHKAISYRSYDRRICHQLWKMSQQMWHHMPKISCGLFDFDWELIFTIISSVTTYLVILMQFDLVNYSQGFASDRH